MLVNLEFESRSLRRSLGKCGENTTHNLGWIVPRGIKVCQRRGEKGHVWADSGSCLNYCHLGSDPKFMHFVSSFVVVS